MSSLIDHLSQESKNTDRIYLYREGVFYKAYERSAYLFVKHIKPFMVKKRLVKSVRREVVSIGFPTNSLYNYFSKEQVREFENGATVELDKKIDLVEFEQWRANIRLIEDIPQNPSGQMQQSSAAEEPTPAAEKNIVMQIKMFPIEAKTPLDCMMFLSNIKKQLE